MGHAVVTLLLLLLLLLTLSPMLPASACCLSPAACCHCRWGNVPGEEVAAEFALGGRERFRLPMGPVPLTITPEAEGAGDQQDADEQDTAAARCVLYAIHFVWEARSQWPPITMHPLVDRLICSSAL